MSQTAAKEPYSPPANPTFVGTVGDAANALDGPYSEEDGLTYYASA